MYGSVDEIQELRTENARLQERLRTTETELERDRESLWEAGREAERTVAQLEVVSLQDGYDSLKCQYDEEHDRLLRLRTKAEECEQNLAEAQEEVQRLQMCEGMARDMDADLARYKARAEETRGRGVWLWNQLQATATAIVQLTIDGIRFLEHDRDRYKARAERRKEALRKFGTHGKGCLARGWKRGDNEYRCSCGLDVAIEEEEPR